MKSWSVFSSEKPALAGIGRKLLFQSRPNIGRAFLATLRKDGAPRLHPVSLVISADHLYVLMPPSSPKCADLIRDGRYALQAFPSNRNREFYLAGCAIRIQYPQVRQQLIEKEQVNMEEDELLFELLLERVMYTRLVKPGTADEKPVHDIWLADH